MLFFQCFCTNFYGFLAKHACQKQSLQVSNSAQSNIHICHLVWRSCFLKLKLTTARDKISPWTLCIVHAHNNLKGNCVLCIDNELQQLPTKMLSAFLTGTQLFCLATLFVPINFWPASGSSNFIKIVNIVNNFKILHNSHLTINEPIVYVNVNS